MEKYNESDLLKEIKSSVYDGDYTTALQLSQDLDLNRIKSISALCLLGEIFIHEKQYDKAEKLLLRAYDKTPKGRRILDLLTGLYIEKGSYSEAEYYYKEFISVASRDLHRYSLRYRLDRGKGERTAVLIHTLEQLKDYEYIEEWAYELARLYHEAGDDKKCIRECDDIVLWFGHGEYVIKALKLKEEITGEKQCFDLESEDEDALDPSATKIWNASELSEQIAAAEAKEEVDAETEHEAEEDAAAEVIDKAVETEIIDGAAEVETDDEVTEAEVIDEAAEVETVDEAEVAEAIDETAEVESDDEDAAEMEAESLIAETPASNEESDEVEREHDNEASVIMQSMEDIGEIPSSAAMFRKMTKSDMTEIKIDNKKDQAERLARAFENTPLPDAKTVEEEEETEEELDDFDIIERDLELEEEFEYSDFDEEEKYDNEAEQRSIIEDMTAILSGADDEDTAVDSDGFSEAAQKTEEIEAAETESDEEFIVRMKEHLAQRSVSMEPTGRDDFGNILHEVTTQKMAESERNSSIIASEPDMTEDEQDEVVGEFSDSLFDFFGEPRPEEPEPEESVEKAEAAEEAEETEEVIEEAETAEEAEETEEVIEEAEAAEEAEEIAEEPKETEETEEAIEEEEDEFDDDDDDIEYGALDFMDMDLFSEPKRSEIDADVIEESELEKAEVIEEAVESVEAPEFDESIQETEAVEENVEESKISESEEVIEEPEAVESEEAIEETEAVEEADFDDDDEDEDIEYGTSDFVDDDLFDNPAPEKEAAVKKSENLEAEAIKALFEDDKHSELEEESESEETAELEEAAASEEVTEEPEAVESEEAIEETEAVEEAEVDFDDDDEDEDIEYGTSDFMDDDLFGVAAAEKKADDDTASEDVEEEVSESEKEEENANVSEEEDSDDDEVIGELPEAVLDIFSTAADISDVKKQLAATFTKFESSILEKQDLLASYEINFVVSGKDESMKSQIAIGIAKALNTYGMCDKNKIVRATADELNNMDFSPVFEKIDGGCLIIVKAGMLSDASVQTLSDYIEQEGQTVAIILEDAEDNMLALWQRYPKLHGRFLNVINIAKYDEMELVRLAQSYAKKNGYDISDEARLVTLRDIFADRMANDQDVNYEDIMAIIDEAVVNLEKRNMKNLFMTVLDNAYKEASMFTLLPEDFE